MSQCEVCHNEYAKTFEIEMNGKKHRFDSFECAIHALAPRCKHCNCRIVGHPYEESGHLYCCPHCASAAIKESWT